MPKPIATGTEKAPLASAVVLTVVAGPPVSVSSDSTTTEEPGVVVPVTVVVEDSTVAPEPGAVRVTVAAFGAPWVT